MLQLSMASLVMVCQILLHFEHYSTPLRHGVLICMLHYAGNFRWNLGFWNLERPFHFLVKKKLNAILADLFFNRAMAGYGMVVTLNA